MFADPQKNIEQFELKAGMLVADIGSGSGFYTFAAAKSVGDSGKVFAVDIQKDLLTKLKNEATKQKLFNIEIVWGDLENVNGSRLASEAVQAAIVSNIFFQVKNKSVFIAEVSRILRPGGRVLFIDWSDSFGGLGPRTQDVFTESMAMEMWQAAGFSKEKNISAGEHHYGIIFVKS